MTYTLLEFALWYAVAALIGGVIGWALCRVRCRSELARARAAAQERPNDRGTSSPADLAAGSDAADATP